jgi:hypothetical protein
MHERDDNTQHRSVQASDEEHAKNWLSFSKKDTFDILAFSRQGCIWLARTSENQVGSASPSSQRRPSNHDFA